MSLSDSSILVDWSQTNQDSPASPKFTRTTSNLSRVSTMDQDTPKPVVVDPLVTADIHGTENAGKKSAVDGKLPQVYEETSVPPPPPPPAANLAEPFIIPHRRRARGRSYSRERSISPYGRYVSRSPSPRRNPRFETEVSSHTELIPPTGAAQTTSAPPTIAPKPDASTRLFPFNRRVYVTYHAATPVDFRAHLGLLALAHADLWYERPGPEALARVAYARHPLPEGAKADILPPLEHPRPVSLNVPVVNAGAALSMTLSKAPPEAVAAADLVYLSVQQTVQGPPVDNYVRRVVPMSDGGRGMPVVGDSLFRVVRAGSRDGAAAKAFYEAGGNRWSTLFTCVVREGDVVSSRPEDYERVAKIEDMLEGGKGGKTKVFY